MLHLQENRANNEFCQQDSNGTFFGTFKAPLYHSAVQDHIHSEHQSPKSLLTNIHHALLSAQDTIKELENQVAERRAMRTAKLLAAETAQSKIREENKALKSENSNLVLNEDSNSKALEECMTIHDETKKIKDEMETRIKRMEEESLTQEAAHQKLTDQNQAQINTLRSQILAAESNGQKMEQQIKVLKKEAEQERAQAAFLKQSLLLQLDENEKQMMYQWSEIKRIKQEKETLWKEKAQITSLHDQINKEKQDIEHRLKGLQEEMNGLLQLTREQQTEISSYRRKLVGAELHSFELEEELNKYRTL